MSSTPLSPIRPKIINPILWAGLFIIVGYGIVIRQSYLDQLESDLEDHALMTAEYIQHTITSASDVQSVAQVLDLLEKYQDIHRIHIMTGSPLYIWASTDPECVHRPLDEIPDPYAIGFIQANAYPDTQTGKLRTEEQLYDLVYKPPRNESDIHLLIEHPMIYIRIDAARHFQEINSRMAWFFLYFITALLLFTLFVYRTLRDNVLTPIRSTLRIIDHLSSKTDAPVYPVQQNREFHALSAQLIHTFQRLDETETRLNLAMSGSSDGFWDWDLETNICWYSPRLKAMIGYTDDEFPHHISSWTSLLHPEDSERVMQSIHRHHVEKTSYHVEYRLRHKSGEYRWFRVRALTLYDTGGKPVRMAGSLQDIHEMKQAEAALRISEERFRTTFESAPIGVALVSLEGNLLQVNRALCDMLGYTQEELQETDFKSITHPDDVNAGIHAVQQLLNRQVKTYQIEKRYLHKQKQIVWASLHASLIQNSEHRPLFFVAQIVDITDKKKSHADLEILNEALLKRTQELTRSNRDLEDFAYAASHDLQEPLRTVVNYMSLLQRKYSTELQAGSSRYIQKSVEAASRMSDLIDDLLTYSRVTTKGKEFTWIDLDDILDHVLKNIDTLVNQHRVQIMRGSLPKVKADSTQIIQLLQNLLINGIKYCKNSPPQIKIRSERKNHFWHIAVQDNGIGIPKASHDRIFQIFQRLHTRAEYSGTGIGLALCKKIVERHGGEIWVESEEEIGSCFIFTLPAQEIHVE